MRVETENQAVIDEFRNVDAKAILFELTDDTMMPPHTLPRLTQSQAFGLALSF